MRQPEPKQYCRVNVIGESEGAYYGPFKNWDSATRFGENHCNLQIESFTIIEEVSPEVTVIDVYHD